MPGFRNVAEYATAYEAGQRRFFDFRKSPQATQVSNAGWWFDLSMIGGYPPPQYYAGAPLEATLLEYKDTGNNKLYGIFHGAAVSPAKLYLRRLNMVSPTAGFVGAYKLMDYVLFYANIEGDELAEQFMDNTITLPRYATGDGVMAMAICQSPTVGGGSFTFKYINQAGAAKTSPVHTCGTTGATAAMVVTSQPAVAGAGQGPFLMLDGGDTGIRRITSLTMLGANGGLMAIALVKPLAEFTILEVNTPIEKEFQVHGVQPVEVNDDAFLGMIVNTAATVASGTLRGYGEFVWN